MQIDGGDRWLSIRRAIDRHNGKRIVIAVDGLLGWLFRGQVLEIV